MTITEKENPRLPYLRDKTGKLTTSPGCYIMKDSSKKIIYIGKAKNLRNRVSSYFRPWQDHLPKVWRMVSHVYDYDFIVTDSEFEALVLECSLIKQYTPKYNILLKDDKGYSYIRVTKEPYPRLQAVLQKEDDGAQYIDTGYTAYGEFAMDMEFMITQIAGNTVYSGVRSSSQLLHVPQVSGEGGDFRFYYGAGDVPSVETAAATLNVRHVAHAQLTRALRVCEIDGRVVARAATSVSPITTDLSIYVGKRNFYGASDTVLAMVGRLYGFRLFRNGTYARDLQPVSSGGVGYMWDSVSNTLLANAGTGSFAVGPDKTA